VRCDVLSRAVSVVRVGVSRPVPPCGGGEGVAIRAFSMLGCAASVSWASSGCVTDGEARVGIRPLSVGFQGAKGARAARDGALHGMTVELFC
jgi:hypothetical protein